MSDGSTCYTSGNSKGRKTDTYTSEARKKQCFSALELARAARHPQPSTDSAAASTLTSSSTTSITPIDISADLCSGVKRSRETVGVTGEQFLSGMFVFRSFGRATYSDLVEVGLITDLQAKLTAYSKARTVNAKARTLVSADELPLSHAAHINLHERVQAVRAVLKDLQCRYDTGGSINSVRNS
jgi:hypothetical protein